MKKVMVLTAAIVIAAMPALADTKNVIFQYNMNTSLTSASKLEGTPEIIQEEKQTRYDFRMTDNIIVSIAEKDNDIRVCSVICKDESESAEFLAQCAASASTIVGFENIYYLYADILDMFLQTRSGETLERRKNYTAQAVYQLTKESFGYLFMIAR